MLYMNIADYVLNVREKDIERSSNMTLEGKVNPRLKGALTKDEFLEQYSKFIKGFYYNIIDREFHNKSIDDLYNHYLESYKYDEENYKIWLERRASNGT